MPIPLKQAMKVGTYVMWQKLKGSRTISSGFDARAIVSL